MWKLLSRIVSRIFPSKASYDGIIAACARSLRRLPVDQVDFYLLYLPRDISSAEWGGRCVWNIARLWRLICATWGESNFDADDMQALFQLAQVVYFVLMFYRFLASFHNWISLVVLLKSNRTYFSNTFTIFEYLNTLLRQIVSLNQKILCLIQ